MGTAELSQIFWTAMRKMKQYSFSCPQVLPHPPYLMTANATGLSVHYDEKEKSTDFAILGMNIQF